MTEKMNPEKSRKLRPLRITLAVLVVILFILILDRLPTSVNSRPSAVETEVETNVPLEEAKYFHFTGFVDIIEDKLQARMQELGVPEEEYSKVSEYLSKDEIYEIECKVDLAKKLSESYVEVDDESIAELKKIFGLSKNYSLERFPRLREAPVEYKSLGELVSDYYTALKEDAE